MKINLNLKNKKCRLQAGKKKRKAELSECIISKFVLNFPLFF
jgi:hypothetical protein